MTIGENIKKSRLAAGLTQKELADKCGIADSAVRKYESGRVVPKLPMIKKLADALNVFITDLTGDGTAGPAFESALEQHAYRLGQKIAGTGARIYGEYLGDQYHVWLQYVDGSVIALEAEDVDDLEAQLDRDAAHTLHGYRLGKPVTQLPEGATAPGYRSSPSAPETDPANE